MNANTATLRDFACRKAKPTRRTAARKDRMDSSGRMVSRQVDPARERRARYGYSLGVYWKIKLGRESITDDYQRNERDSGVESEFEKTKGCHPEYNVHLPERV